MARAATAPELALFRTEKRWSKTRAAILPARVVYTARINQVFSSWDGVLELAYDTGSGTLANVLPDMTLLIGSTAGAHDVGIVRLRDKDADTFFIGETSDVKFANDQHLTVLEDFSLWARHVRISAGVPFMDGGIAYSDQHLNFDPAPIMGSHRVLKLTGASVSTQFNFSGSYCLGSSISAYSCSAPTASSSSGMTTATPTITFNTVGWHAIYLTLTAANGKTFFGMRWVFVWNESNQPSSVEFNDSPHTDVETGGWSFDITLSDDVDVDTVRDHALVILFAEDHYGSTEQSIGPVVGCENIVVTGWIARESISWNPEQSKVRFTGYTAQYWFAQIPSYPDGVELVTGTPAAWTEIQGLTVNKGLFHFLRWRTTATRVMDVFLTDDTKYTKEVSSLAQNLWEQLREMSFLQIYARPGVNALNQLFVEVHPQLVPEASRTWATVMTITKQDWRGEIDFDRVTMNEVAAVSLSGVAVNESGVATALFSLSAGHVFSHYGKPDIQDRLLVSSQSQANTLCGLYFSWKNNPFPDIPIVLSANNRLIDCFPRQQCDITIAAGDTPRGIEYAGGLIPTSVAYVPDPETGYLHTEVTFEAETGLTADVIAVNGDVPGSGDISIPPLLPSFPSLPDFPIILPGVPELDPEATFPVLLHDLTKGLLYCADINITNPQWITINSGLTSAQYQKINRIVITPSGAIYVACRVDSGLDPPFIAYATSIGATFTIIEDSASILAKFPGTTVQFVNSIACNPLSGMVAYVIGGNSAGQCKIYTGTGTTFAAGAVITDHNFTSTARLGSLSYGFGKWLLTGWNTNAASINAYWVISANGATVTATAAYTGGGSNKGYHIRAGTTDKTFHFTRSDGNIDAATGNFTAVTTVGDGLINPGVTWPDNIMAVDPTGLYLMGRWSTQKGKSSDGGATWSALSSLPPGNWWWSFVGGTGTGSWWLAAGGSSIRLSKDFGTTWLNREGNLLSVAPIPNIDMIKALV